MCGRSRHVLVADLLTPDLSCLFSAGPPRLCASAVQVGAVVKAVDKKRAPDKAPLEPAVCLPGEEIVAPTRDRPFRRAS